MIKWLQSTNVEYDPSSIMVRNRKTKVHFEEVCEAFN